LSMTIDKNSVILSLLRDKSPQFDFEIAEGGAISAGTLQARMDILLSQGLVSSEKVVDPEAGTESTLLRRHYALTPKGRAHLLTQSALANAQKPDIGRFGLRRR
jgi:DNA-binding PadR family transcriptional regulator